MSFCTINEDSTKATVAMIAKYYNMNLAKARSSLAPLAMGDAMTRTGHCIVFFSPLGLFVEWTDAVAELRRVPPALVHVIGVDGLLTLSAGHYLRYPICISRYMVSLVSGVVSRYLIIFQRFSAAFGFAFFLQYVRFSAIPHISHVSP